jgi:hypothetical protein
MWAQEKVLCILASPDKEDWDGRGGLRDYTFIRKRFERLKSYVIMGKEIFK